MIMFIANAQNITPLGREVNFAQFSSDEGLELYYIRNLYEDSKGRIWVCANGGLAMYNGKNFIYYSTKEGLKGNDVLAAVEDNNHKIWVGTNRGLFYLKKNRFYAIDSASGLPFKQTVWSLFKDADGTLWAGGTKGIHHINPNDSIHPLIKKYKPFKSEDHNGIRYFKRKKNGDLIATGDHGYFLFQKDSFVNQNLPGTIYSVIEQTNEKEVYSGWETPLFRINKTKLDSDYNIGAGFMKMEKDDKNNIWLASWDKGLIKFDGKKFTSYGNKEGLNANSFWCTIKDKEGNMWFGSYGQGLFKYTGERFTKITEKNGLFSNNVNDMVIDSTGLIWISTENSVSCFDPVNGTIKNYTQFNGQPFRKIMRIVVSDRNEILALGYGGNGYKISIKKDQVTSEEWIGGFCAAYDKYGRFCVGTEGHGVRIIENNKKIDYYMIKGDPSTGVDIYKDLKQNLWIMTDVKGINYSNYKSTINFNSKNGFINNLASCIINTKENEYWIGTYGRGLIKCQLINESQIKILDSIKTENGLPNNSIASIHLYNNQLIIGTSKGICTLNMEQYSRGIKQINHYAKDEGLVNDRCAVSFIDKNGKVWISTRKGVYIFDMDYKSSNSVETGNIMLDVKLFYEKIDTSEMKLQYNDFGLPVNMDLPYDKNHITFSFIGICHTAQSKVKYKFILEGLDKEWSSPSERNEVTYSNLPAGKYKFKMISSNNEGVWSKEPLIYEFVISPPFWKTNWFIILVTVTLIALIYSFFQYKQRKLIQQNHILETKVIERTSELKQQKELVEEKNKEITDSINYASKIQGVLLPSAEEMNSYFPESFTLFKPKDIVSGDFYWIVKKDDLIYLAVCDSTGHGVPGAFMSLLNLNLLNEAIIEKNINAPNEVFNYVRQQLINSISKEGQKDGFDGILICYNKMKKQFTYAASNNNPVIIKNKELIHLPNDKMPVGKGESNESFKLFSCNIAEGDALYLYTDGYADQFGGPKGKKFKYKQLDELLISVSELSTAEQHRITSNSFDDWKGTLEQVDDVCMIGIKF